MAPQNLIPTRFANVVLDAPLGNNCMGLTFAASGTVRVQGTNNGAATYADIAVVQGQTISGNFGKVLSAGTVGITGAQIMASFSQ